MHLQHLRPAIDGEQRLENAEAMRQPAVPAGNRQRPIEIFAIAPNPAHAPNLDPLRPRRKASIAPSGFPRSIRTSLNYLSHLFLAENNAGSRVGSLLGDFVTGRPESLHGRFPEAVLHGIVRHRAIDRFTDSHRVTARLRSAVAPARRRFAGVISDIVHDHFLTRRWAEFSPLPFRTFIDQCNGALREHHGILPPELGGTLEARIEDDWLGHYGTDEGLDGVFHRVALRHHGFSPIRDAVQDLKENRAVFEAAFDEFFPDLVAWVGKLGPEADTLI